MFLGRPTIVLEIMTQMDVYATPHVGCGSSLVGPWTTFLMFMDRRGEMSEHTAVRQAT